MNDYTKIGFNPDLIMVDLIKYVKNNDLTGVKDSIGSGEGINQKSKYGKTALMYAAEEGHVQVLTELIKQGAELDEGSDINGKSALMYASERDHLDLIKVLVRCGADIGKRSKVGKSAVEYASESSKTEIMSILAGTMNNKITTCVNRLGAWTDLMLAAYLGEKKMVIDFLKKGSRIDEEDECGWSALMIAAHEGHFAVVEVLLEKKANIEKRDHDGKTAFMISVLAKRIEMANYLKRKGAKIDNKRDQGITLLMDLIDDLDLVSYLIFIGADVDERNDKGESVLMHAAATGRVDIVRELIAHDVRVDVKCKDGVTALMYASCEGHEEVIRVLIDRDKNVVNEKNALGETILMHLVRHNKLELVKYAIENGSDIHAKDNEGETVLMHALLHSGIGLIRYLVSLGMDIEQKNRKGETLLIKASRLGKLKIVKELLKERINANIHVKDHDGKTALMHAVWMNHHKVMVELMDRGVVIDEKDRDGKTALMYALEAGHMQLVKELIRRGSGIDQKDREGKSVLMFILKSGKNNRLAMMKYLMAQGADNNQRNQRGDTVLIQAATMGHLSLVKELLSRGGIRIDEKDNRGATALMYAADRNELQVVKCLVAKGAEIECVDNNRCTALRYAAEAGNTDIVAYFLSKKAEIDTYDYMHTTPLMIASEEGHFDVVRALLNGGTSSINDQNADGMTALMYAARAGHIGIVKDLLESNADLDLRDVGGAAACDHAEYYGHIEVVEYIKLCKEHSALMGSDRGCKLNDVMGILREIDIRKSLSKPNITIAEVENLKCLCALDEEKLNFLYENREIKWPKEFDGNFDEDYKKCLERKIAEFWSEEGEIRGYFVCEPERCIISHQWPKSYSKVADLIEGIEYNDTEDTDCSGLRNRLKYHSENVDFESYMKYLASDQSSYKSMVDNYPLDHHQLMRNFEGNAYITKIANEVVYQYSKQEVEVKEECFGEGISQQSIFNGHKESEKLDIRICRGGA